MVADTFSTNSEYASEPITSVATMRYHASFPDQQKLHTGALQLMQSRKSRAENRIVSRLVNISQLTQSRESGAKSGDRGNLNSV